MIKQLRENRAQKKARWFFAFDAEKMEACDVKYASKRRGPRLENMLEYPSYRVCPFQERAQDILGKSEANRRGKPNET